VLAAHYLQLVSVTLATIFRVSLDNKTMHKQHIYIYGMYPIYVDNVLVEFLPRDTLKIVATVTET
jgi:hypothetical protein